MIEVLILFFSFLFSLPMLTSGWITSEGVRLWGVNARDGIWNLALIEELKNHFPPDHPGFAGQPLRAYHFLYHLLLAIISKITFIPALNLYFHIFPLIISFLWGWGVYLLVNGWFKDKKAALWSVFFSFFGGSFAFVLPLIGQKKLSIDSGFGIAQPFGSSQVNPAFASSLVLVIWSLLALFKYLRSGERKWVFLLILSTSLSIGFKVYAGMILLGALLVASFWRVVFEKEIDLLFYCVIAILLAVLVFFPVNSNYGFLVWAPFWPLFRLVEGPLKFTGWYDLWLQYRVYMNYLNLWLLGVLIFLVFFFGNLGTRVIALVSLKDLVGKGIKNPHMRKLNPLSTYNIYYLTTLGISFFIPLFFLQPTGGGFNIIQMYWYFLFLLSLLVGPAVVKLVKQFKRIFLRYLFYFVFLSLTLATSFSVFGALVSNQSLAIDLPTLQLLEFLKGYKNYEATVLVIPKIKDYNYENLERWFWSYSSVLIPALGGKRLYIANEVVSFPYEDKERRLKILERFLRPAILCRKKTWRTKDCEKALFLSFQLLKKEQIALIYSFKRVFWLDKWDKVKLIFNNKAGRVYEVLSL